MCSLLKPNFVNYKIGEVFCSASENIYHVNCQFCEETIDFENFKEHFEAKHFAEQTVNDEKLEAVASDVEQMLEEHEDETLIDIQKLIKTEKIAVLAPNDSKLNQQQDFVWSNSDDEILADAALKIADEKDAISIAGAAVEDHDDDTIENATQTDEDDGETLQDTFECNLCKKQYKKKSSLKCHLSMVHKWKPKLHYQFKCDECGKALRTARLLETHKYKHFGLFCKICGKKFANLGGLNVHEARHKKTRSLKCEQCDKCFLEKKELMAHALIHKPRTVVCEVCAKRLINSTQLKSHMLRHTGERPAECGICGKCFYSQHDLNVHSVTHSNERPFQCEVCSATFALKKSLRVHKKKHLNKPLDHVCYMCGKAFAAAKGLEAHMRTHDKATSNVTIQIE